MTLSSKREVSSEDIAVFDPMVKQLARKYNGVANAEYDDLRQEGLIAVWLALLDDYVPTRDFIKNRMKNWIRKCRRKGFTGY